MLAYDDLFNCSVIGGEVKFKDESLDASVADDEIIMKPYSYYKDTFTYTDFPTVLAKAFNYWLEVPEEDFNTLHHNTEISIISKLLLEDMLADRKTREGKPTAHVVFGMPHVMNTYFFCNIALAQVKLGELNQVLGISANESIKESRFFQAQQGFTDEGICPTEEIYLEVAGFKTVLGFLTSEIRILQELYSKKIFPELEKITNDIKIFFAIIAECKSIVNDDDTDLRLGNFTLPIIYAIQSSVDTGRTLLNIIRQKTSNTDLTAFALALVKKSSALDQCKKKLYHVRCAILAQYKKFDENLLLEEFFDKHLIVPDNFEDVTYILR